MTGSVALHTPTRDTPATQPVTSQAFRDVFAQLPAGVTVVTTSGPGAVEPSGMTASAVCSLSLDPLLVLLCLNNHSNTLARLKATGSFAINILRNDQAHWAEQFADSRISQAARFARTPHHHTDGVPVLTEALAWLTCKVAQTHPGGDHTIVTGHVRTLGSGHGAGAEPLVWHSRTFRTLA
ncbi:flavin reductase family protein [Streptomyces erythrochromogenes]|uniref:flavin reductase family protein n=1 Tax=Streptomyces erythrochromogenes TaxID=285574 RepID=UPI002252C265|nr:flavin reductase family protein [Streptomyces erythrochromogenes]MCX5582925.1 flavin reductase family protein [Streptomyces erythrochromogenes]